MGLLHLRESFEKLGFKGTRLEAFPLSISEQRPIPDIPLHQNVHVSAHPLPWFQTMTSYIYRAQ
jgi:hypothetical protein